MKDEGRHVTREIVKETVDLSTGEVTSQEKSVTYSQEVEPDFVKIYLQDVSRLFNLPSGCSTIMYEMLNCMNYENLIAITPYIRNSIAKKLNTSVDVINHAIVKLTKQGLITKLGAGTYMANPDVFGKGKWKDIKMLRAKIEYSPDGRTFVVEKNPPIEQEFEGFRIADMFK